MTCGLKVGASPRPATLRAFGQPPPLRREQPVPEPGSAAAVAVEATRHEPADATGTQAVAEVVPLPRSRPGSTAPGVWKPGPPAEVWTKEHPETVRPAEGPDTLPGTPIELLEAHSGERAVARLDPAPAGGGVVAQPAERDWPEGIPAAATEPIPLLEKQKAPPRTASGTHPAAGTERSEKQGSGAYRAVQAGSGEHPKTRPPVLASEALREDIEPTEPGRRVIRVVGVVLGLAGAIGALAVGDLEGPTTAAAAALVAIALACIAPLAYALRAALVSVVALGALALLAGPLGGGIALDPLVTGGTLLLGSGLLFRGAYRASIVGRVMVGAGLLVVGAWFVIDGAFDGLSRFDAVWQLWAPSVVRIGFLVTLLLSLFAFMPSSTTAGARGWAALLLACYAVEALLAGAIAIFPAGEGFTGLPNTTAGTAIGVAMLGPLGAVGLFHVLVSIVRRLGHRRDPLTGA